MLIKVATLRSIVDGNVDLAFRRWKRPRVTAGSRIRTAVGELAIDAVDRVAMRDITAEEARRAGFDSREALLAMLRGRDGHTYRVRLSYAGEDRRRALRDNPDLGAEEHGIIAAKLARMDARSPGGPWTARVLAAIDRAPATRAGDLAVSVGMERMPFKRHVQKLKELGLTESLEIGYRISPRGRAFLER